MAAFCLGCRVRWLLPVRIKRESGIAFGRLRHAVRLLDPCSSSGTRLLRADRGADLKTNERSREKALDLQRCHEHCLGARIGKSRISTPLFHGASAYSVVAAD